MPRTPARFQVGDKVTVQARQGVLGDWGSVISIHHPSYIKEPSYGIVFTNNQITYTEESMLQPGFLPFCLRCQGTGQSRRRILGWVRTFPCPFCRGTGLG